MTDNLPPSDTARIIWYDPAGQQQALLSLLARFGTWVYTERVREAIGKHTLDKLRAAEDQVRQRLNAEFTLAVVGNFKNGKSTLINALLGMEVVPADVDPETVTINQISYGPNLHAEAVLVDGGRMPIDFKDLPRKRLVPVLDTIRSADAASPQTPHERDRALRDILVNGFNQVELRELCFDLGVEYDEIRGEGLTDAVLRLISFMRRRGRFEELVEACYRYRPAISEGLATAAPAAADTGRVAQRLSSLERLRTVLNHLQIEAPVDWVRGICLVDTPGLGDLYGFDEQVRLFLPRCDAIIFVTQSKSPLSEEERTFLKRYVLPRDFAKIFFVVNRLDDMRSEADVNKVLQRVRDLAGELFPGAPLFGISASEELARLEGARVANALALLRANEFERLRTALQESILLNRDVIRLNRAVTQADQMLIDFIGNIEQLQRAIAADRDRRSVLISQYENRSSTLHKRKDEHKHNVRTSLGALSAQAATWMMEFLTRFETIALASLAAVPLDAIQRDFRFFLVDVLRAALSQCLEAQRPQMLELLANTRKYVRDDVELMNGLLDVGHASEVVVRAQIDDLSWARLDDLHQMVDQSAVSIFALAEELVIPVVGILLNNQRNTDQQGRVAYQEKLREKMPELRQSITVELQDLYRDLAHEIELQIDLAHKQDIDDALAAVSQAQIHHEMGQEEVAAVQTICAELLDLIAEAREELAALKRKLNLNEV